MKPSMGFLLAATMLAAAPGLQAADDAPDGGGPYAIVAAGGSRYGFDCWATPFNCAGGHGSARKAVLGWRQGQWGAEWLVMDYGRASTEQSIATRPGETIRLRATGLSWVGHGRMGEQWRVAGRLGVARVQHDRTGELPMRTWSPTVGLGFTWLAMPWLGLEFAWDLTAGEGSDSGTSAANALTLGLRLGF